MEGELELKKKRHKFAQPSTLVKKKWVGGNNGATSCLIKHMIEFNLLKKLKMRSAPAGNRTHVVLWQGTILPLEHWCFLNKNYGKFTTIIFHILTLYKTYDKTQITPL